MEIPAEPKIKEIHGYAVPSSTDSSKGSSVPAEPSPSFTKHQAREGSQVLDIVMHHQNHPAVIPEYPFTFWAEELPDLDAGSETAMEYNGKALGPGARRNDWWRAFYESPVFPESLKQQLQDGDSWQLGGKIGEGSFGVVAEVFRVDREGVIQETIAVKEIVGTDAHHPGCYEFQVRIKWRDPLAWLNRLPREIALLQRLHLGRSISFDFETTG